MNMKNETKITPEEFVKDFFGDSYCMVGLEERQNLHSMLKEYVNLQTASLREELRDLHEEIQVMHGKFIRTGEGDIMHASYAYHEIASILDVPEGGSVIETVQQLVRNEANDARTKELEAVKKEHDRLVKLVEVEIETLLSQKNTSMKKEIPSTLKQITQKAESKSLWIKTSDSLPQTDEPIIVETKSGKVYIGYYDINTLNDPDPLFWLDDLDESIVINQIERYIPISTLLKM